MPTRLNPLELTREGVPLPDGEVAFDISGTRRIEPHVLVHATALRAEHDDLGKGVHAIGPFTQTLADLVRADKYVSGRQVEVRWCSECIDGDSDFELLAGLADEAGSAVSQLRPVREAVAKARAADAGWCNLGSAVIGVYRVARSWIVDPGASDVAAAEAVRVWSTAQVEGLWVQLRTARDQIASRLSSSLAIGPWVLAGVTEPRFAWTDQIWDIEVLATCAGNILDGPPPMQTPELHPTLMRVPTRGRFHGDPDDGVWVTTEFVDDEDVALLPLAATLWQPYSGGPLADPVNAWRAARDLQHVADADVRRGPRRAEAEHLDGTPLSGELAHECPKCEAPAVADGALLTGRCRCPQGHRWQDTAPVPQKASAH